MGGAEVFTHEVLKRWAAAGHKVTLFTAKFRGSKQNEVDDGVNIVRSGGTYSVYWKAREYYRRYFSKEEYDVVIDEINTVPFLASKFVRRGEKVVALIHQLAREYWFYETPFPASYFGYYLLEKRWLKNYRKIPTVTVSESSRKDLAELGFEKVFVVGEGLNFEPLEKSDEKTDFPVIVFVGRLKRAKRPDNAVEAFRMIKQRVPNAELWIIGGGYLREKLVRNAPEGVRFFDPLSNKERRDLIKKSWVLVNPSVREGFGLNVIEANALGVPSVAYNVAGLRDAIVDGITGLLSIPKSTEDLANAVIRILADADLRNRLSEEALVRARNFNWDKVADEFMRIIRTA
ncbi:MAG TPA: glycosyltransferase family 4 protein [candidate division Zixibacteria bacterium]|nr:glycosyltransferase family 4 protein [candidate division Zixibacteria bacterium]